MHNSRLKIPDDLKEFIGLVRKGRLYDVEKWIASGKTFRMPPGNWAMTPLQTALLSGFHSMVEVLAKAGMEHGELNHALLRAVYAGRLDIAQVLVKHGADPTCLSLDEVIAGNKIELIRWFVENGYVELEKGFPIAVALWRKHREFLGVYMSLRDRIPSARRQAAMALRKHCRDGNVKWVSLLLWAGVDPRESVPDIEYYDEEICDTSLEAAIHGGQVEIVKKIKIDPKRDDITGLLRQCCPCRNPAMVQLLLEAGADPNGKSGETSNNMNVLISNFVWSVAPI